MPKEILAGSTNQTIDVFIQDSSSTAGAGLTGLAFNTASLTCYYRLGATGSATALSLATQTVGGAHSDGGFVEIDATNMPGMYRLDLSDAMVATAGLTKIQLKGATNMAPVQVEIEVVAVNKYDGVRLGLTALPNSTNLSLSAGTIVPGTVDTGSFSSTTTQFEADDITEATADHYNGRVIIFTSGALQNQATTISDYVLSGSNGKFTVVALTEAPGNNDTFIIV